MTSAPAFLRRLERTRDPRWDAYVQAHPEGSFFHLLGWRRVIQRGFGHRPHYLFAEREGEICGVLPLFISGKRPFPSALVSVPLGVTGGILASDADAIAVLRQGARELAEQEQLAYVEYKSEKRLFDDLPTKDDLYFVFRQELFGDRDKQLAAVPRKARAVLRESQRHHLRSEYTRDALEPFYDLYAASMRNLGTPMFPKALFEACLEEFPRHCDFVVIREAGRIIGVVMNFYYQQVMLPFFAGAVPEARDAGINNFMYWAMLETGYDLGYRTFDFGRSKAGTGAFRFKKNMGMDPIPLEYQYDLVTADAMPQINPNNPKYDRVINTWRRLPVELTKRLGPLVQRRLP